MIQIPSRQFHDPRSGAFVSVDIVHAQQFQAHHPHLVALDEGDECPPPAPLVGEAIRLCDAATQYSEVAGIRRDTARKDIQRAAEAGEIPSRKDGGALTLDINTLSRWIISATIERRRREAREDHDDPPARWRCTCGTILRDSHTLTTCPECGADAADFSIVSREGRSG